jgi:hypothetical protein
MDAGSGNWTLGNYRRFHMCRVVVWLTGWELVVRVDSALGRRRWLLRGWLLVVLRLLILLGLVLALILRLLTARSVVVVCTRITRVP